MISSPFTADPQQFSELLTLGLEKCSALISCAMSSWALPAGHCRGSFGPGCPGLMRLKSPTKSAACRESLRYGDILQMNDKGVRERYTLPWLVSISLQPNGDLDITSY